ncbi:MAG: hypothetical protein JWO09_3168 [Bacteroidetes bacterium]|nr:hypothetical protein [Bacteroidota bacterium]
MNIFIRIPLLISFFAFAGIAPAQDTSLVKPRDIHYTSDFEKKYFESFLNTGKADIIPLAISLSELSTDFEYKKTEEAINALIAESDKKILNEKDVSKKVKFLFGKVHSSLFKRYDITAHFEKIFSAGIYNCVTASMLYAFLFEHYSIPYKIMEKPRHVYLIADPNDKKIVVESTDPTSGYFLPNDKFKKEYVDYLVKNKLVAKTDLELFGYDALFEKTYYADEKINLKQLVGLQYYNSAVEFLNAKEYTKTLYQAQKAYVLYPCDRNRFLLTGCYPLILQDKDFSDLRDVDLLIAYYKTNPDDKSIFYEAFYDMTEKFLVNENKHEHYDKIFNKLTTEIRDSVFLDKVYLTYYSEYARIEYMNGEYKKAFDHLLLAYSRNPDNAKVKAMFATLVVDQMRSSNDYKKIITDLDGYVLKYPFLKGNVYLEQTYGNLFLLLANNYFAANNEKQGLYYLKLFEQKAETKDMQFNDVIIGTAYSEAWAYYVRMQKRQYAKQFINKGLKYAPYNGDLQRKKKIADEDTN